MEEKNIKKKKLTISLSSKKPNNIPSFKKGYKKSVIIEKKISGRRNERRFSERENNLNKSRFADKTQYYAAYLGLMKFLDRLIINHLHCHIALPRPSNHRCRPRIVPRIRFRAHPRPSLKLHMRRK